MPKICYNCGKELNKDNSTVEHVPAKNLYEGFGDEFKVNRITVPACSDCNNLYSKIDHELRDALAVKTEDIAQRRELTGKGVRSIMQRKNWKERAYVDINGRVTAVNFSYSDLRDFHIKNFKALFFKKYGFPVPEDFIIEIIADGDEELINTASRMYEYAQDGKAWEVSGHSNIFKFIIKDITPDEEKGIICESGDFTRIVAVTGILVYHEDMCAIVVAGKKDYVEKCKPKE